MQQLLCVDIITPFAKIKAKRESHWSREERGAWQENFLYVDKTSYVYRLAHSGRQYFLSRPRRFGKSLPASVPGRGTDIFSLDDSLEAGDTDRVRENVMVRQGFQTFLFLAHLPDPLQGLISLFFIEGGSRWDHFLPGFFCITSIGTQQHEFAAM